MFLFHRCITLSVYDIAIVILSIYNAVYVYKLCAKYQVYQRMCTSYSLLLSQVFFRLCFMNVV